jgi:hypothetical protein
MMNGINSDGTDIFVVDVISKVLKRF